MMLAMLTAIAGVGSPGQYVQPLDVGQPVRLELTPTLDGRIDKEEWDPFGPQTYFQWEPGRLYVAGQMSAGKDLVLTIDGKADGWLVGRDNLEFRISVQDGKPVVTVRELDATAVKQPIWRERHDLEAASMAAISVDGDQISVEGRFDDANLGVLPTKPKDLSMRLDIVDSQADHEAYLPRACTRVRLDDHREIALPTGMDSAIQSRTRSVIPGESIFLRVNFHGNNKLGLKTIDLRTLGDAEDSANRMSIVFPKFDNKGRAFVDYQSRIDPSAGTGYRIMRGTLAFADGPNAMVEASYRIAPFLDLTLMRTSFDRLPENNRIRIPYMVQLYTRQPAEGTVRIAPPAGWEVVKGDVMKFDVLGNQSAAGGQVELKAPADAHGTFPIEVTAETKTHTVTQTCYVTIR